MITDKATLTLRGDLTVGYHDGRVKVIAERQAPSGGRAYWGVSHEILIRDFYDTSRTPNRFGSARGKRRSRSGARRTSTGSPTRSRLRTERQQLRMTGSIPPPARSTPSRPNGSTRSRPAATRPHPKHHHPSAGSEEPTHI